MSNYEILSREPIAEIEVLNFIKKKEKEIELTYREEKVRIYLKEIVKLKKRDFDAAKKELQQLEIPRLEENHIIKILEIMPKNPIELRSIVSHSGTVIVEQNIKKILAVLKKYV